MVLRVFVYFHPQKMALPYYARWAKTLITMLKLLRDVYIMVLGFTALSVNGIIYSKFP